MLNFPVEAEGPQRKAVGNLTQAWPQGPCCEVGRSRSACVHMQDSGHTPEWNGPKVERPLRNGKHIYLSAFKAWLVEQASRLGASGLALRNGVNANLLRHWMRL